MAELQSQRTWVESDRIIPRRFVRPFRRFTELEASSGAVLLIAAVVALLWSNLSIFGDTYSELWETRLDLEIGGFFHLDETLRELVNDALMTLFFFVVGLEIKRELRIGDLRDPRAAALPVFAAIGGMIFPALIFLSFNGAGDASRGWGIPMATDIAFAVGIVALLGPRIPRGAKLFLLALAIADDIGAIVVIAIFYTDELSPGWLVFALLGFALMYGAKQTGVVSIGFYWVVGIIVWFAVFESGVHPTLAGVAMGFLTPTTPHYSGEEYDRRARATLNLYSSEETTPVAREKLDHEVLQLARVSRDSVSPLTRLEEGLHPWTSFLVVPLFALANAGIDFGAIDFGEAITSDVALGVALGLVVGKTIGVTIFTWLALRLHVGVFPRGTGWSDIVGLAALAGVGFTVSLFITELAFTDPVLTDEAKIGIFIGSAVAGVIGYLLLRFKSPRNPDG